MLQCLKFNQSFYNGLFFIDFFFVNKTQYLNVHEVIPLEKRGGLHETENTSIYIFFLTEPTMVMETPSAQCVGREFVRQYYTLLHEAPDYLHRYVLTFHYTTCII